jgi:NAD(P)-dependent dehydrogenase (short-subunit alcohol dehydrogenase family)
MDWHGKVVVVSGASAGVGRAAARAFGEAGASVGLIARGEDGLEAAAKEIESTGGHALAVSTDVADSAAVDDAAAAVEERLGPIDVWVNVAMASVFARFWEIAPEEFQRVTDVTYLGYVHGTHAALRRMRARDHGTIVQVGSALAYRAIPLQSAYCGAKHAIVGFTSSLRTELMAEHSSVRVTMVHLPAVNTPQFGWVLSRLPRRPQPVAPIFQPEVPARMILHAAAHPERREYWVAWSTARAILGNRVVPGLLDRYLARKGIDAQQTNERDPHDRPVNLWSPVAGDHGAHGAFDQRALRASRAAWICRHRRLALCAGGLSVSALTAAATSSRRDHR